MAAAKSNIPWLTIQPVPPVAMEKFTSPIRMGIIRLISLPAGMTRVLIPATFSTASAMPAEKT